MTAHRIQPGRRNLLLNYTPHSNSWKRPLWILSNKSYQQIFCVHLLCRSPWQQILLFKFLPVIKLGTYIQLLYKVYFGSRKNFITEGVLSEWTQSLTSSQLLSWHLEFRCHPRVPEVPCYLACYDMGHFSPVELFPGSSPHLQGGLPICNYMRSELAPVWNNSKRGEEGNGEGRKGRGKWGEESAAQTCLDPCGGLGEKQLPRLPASLSVSVAMTVLGMMDICSLMGVDEGGDNVDVKNKQTTTKCIFYSK